MMEDEECLPENSSLKLYLQNLGFSDLQVMKNNKQNPSSIRFEVPELKSKVPYVETIDEDVIDQISIIISTQMLFEEDISKIEKLLSNFKVVKNGIFKSMFKDFLGVAVIFLGLCLYWAIGHYAFFIISSFYAFSAACYLRQKHTYRSRLKKLTSILQANFVLLKKTVKFIEENRLIEANNAFVSNSLEYLEGFDFYKNFKSDFLTSIGEMIDILIQSTQKLIITIPLYKYIENPEYYLCNNFSKNYESSDLSKLYEIYLLIQSEFLQRLILSLIPNINLATKNNFRDLNRILTETCISLLKIKNRLNKKFKFIFLNGIHSPKTKVEYKVPLKVKSQNNYFKEFALNIHETSRTFQNLLLKCRILEENLLLDKIPDYVEEELVKIQADLSACQRNIADSFILIKKLNFSSENPNESEAFKILSEKEVENSVESTNKVMVGYTDLDPKIEDEIFEAHFTNENDGHNLSDIDDFNVDGTLDKKLEKEYCKNIMKELKLKLVEKANYWKEKEKELLKKKGIVNESESSDEDKEEEVENNLGTMLLPNSSVEKKSSFECQKVFPNSEIKPENFSIETTPINCHIKFNVSETDHIDNGVETAGNEEEILNLQNEHCQIENTQVIGGSNQGFLNDLIKARQKIFKSSLGIEEELFCTLNEDLSEDDAPT